MTSPSPTRNAYRFRGPETWAAIREAFMAGETAAAIAARFGVTDGAIRQRAYREGWTRKALAAAAEAPLRRRAACAQAAALSAAPDTPPGPPLEPYELLDRVLNMASAAVCAGRSEEALRLTNLGERLLPLAEEARRLRPVTLEQAASASREMREMVEAAAQRTVEAALTDPESAPPPLRDWARRWRAAHVVGSDADIAGDPAAGSP